MPLHRPHRVGRSRPVLAKMGQVETLEPRCLLAGLPVISEFMAANTNTLQDAEGDYSDWIEIYNRGDEPIELGGWFLTDDPDDLNQWQFPSQTLNAGEYLVVFASGKNEAIGTELHTNFRLSSSGEYLALVSTDGETVATEFALYPPQVTDVSFGLGVDAAQEVLLDAAGPIAAHVPTSDSLGDSWLLTNFDDATWRRGNGGVGYNVGALAQLNIASEMQGVNTTAYTRQVFAIENAEDVDALTFNVQYDDGFVAYLNGQEIAHRNGRPAGTSPAAGLVSYWNFDGSVTDQASNYANNSGVATDTFAPRGGTIRYATGVSGQALAIGVQAGDATDLVGTLTDDVKLPAQYTIEAWVRPTELSQEWQRLVLNWGSQFSYHFAIRNNSGYANAVSLFHGTASGAQPNANGGTVRLNEWQHIAGVADGQMLRVYLNGVQVDAVPYDGTITTATSEGLGLGDSATGLSNIKYNGWIDDLAMWEVPLTAAQIQSHFVSGADGYGLTTAENPVELGWDSAASDTRMPGAEGDVESIDITPFLEFLQPGDNVLAIHGLNAAIDDADFLIRAGLVGSTLSLNPAVQRYFTASTPGGPNGTGVSDLGPIVDEVRHEFLAPTGITTTPLVDRTSTVDVLVPTSNVLGSDWISSDYVLGSHGENWSRSTSGAGVGYDTDNSLDAEIDVDLQATAQGVNSSAYLRTQFDVTDPSNVDELWLNMKYDDGFVAYLNGELVTSRNAPVGGTSPVSGLRTYYSFDGDIQDRAADYQQGSGVSDDHLTAAAATGTLAISFGPGVSGQAVRVSRQANQASMLTAADSADLDLAANWTLEGWVYPDSDNTGDWDRFVTKWFPGTTSWHWTFRGANNGMDLFIGRTTGGTTNILNNNNTASVPLNSWSHVALTGNSGTGLIEAWLNGVVVGTAPYESVLNGDAALSFGNFRMSDAAFQFSGWIDDFAIWDVALSAEQLASHASGGGYGLQTLAGGPVSIPWNAEATAARTDAQATTPEAIDISAARSVLRTGTNVLAIQLLNISASDSDMLASAELIARSGSETDSPLRITANVTPTLNPVGDVSLTYRVMFGEEISVAMRDDGLGGDETAADGVFTARLASSIARPGEMIRYFISADDDQQISTRAPLFEDPTNSPEYFGTVVEDLSVTTELPVFHRFIENEAAAETGSGTRASVFYNGEFYDNVFIRIRGGTARSWPKKSYKIAFNDGYHFEYRPGAARVDEFNLNTTYTDKSYMRAILSYNIHTAAGSPAPETFALQVRQNAKFFSVAHFVEQPDRDFLRRNNLDPDGSLYKGNANPTNGLVGNAAGGAFDKETRKDEDFADLQALIDGLALTGPALETFVFDHVDLAAQVNFMAVNVILQNIDATDKNFYIYRDTEGDGEWQMLPWDLDLVLGPNALNTDTIVANQDAGPAYTSHPYLGTLTFPYYGRKNHLFDAIINNPRTNDMFLRRLRTLMDTVLAASDTPESERFIESRIDTLAELLGPDVLLDRARWGGTAHFPGSTYTLQQAIDRIKNEYLEPRRTHLFVTHSQPSENDEVTTLLESSAPTRALVPVSGALGTSWTMPTFNDSAWISGTSGVGYDEATDYLSLLGIDLRSTTIPAAQRIDTNGDGTSENDSVYLRIPFEVDDPNALTELKLLMKYDDGFVAYINGVRVASANAPASLAWNSAAAALNDDGRALSFEAFDISAFGGPGGILVPGTNLLAIHGLNDATNGTGTSSDMLILPEIVNGTFGSATSVGIFAEQPAEVTLEFGDYEANPSSGNQDEEFVEVRNPNTFAVDVSGWRLTGGIEYTFAPGTVIPAGESIYASPNVREFRERATGPAGQMGLYVQGPYAGHLSNEGELIRMLTADGDVVATLTLPSELSDMQRFLRVSELHYHPSDTLGGVEFIEFTNISAGPSAVLLDLSGVTISDGPSEPFVFAAGTILQPGGHLVVAGDTTAFQAAYPTVSASRIAGQFAGSLSNSGEQIKIDDVDGSTVLEFTYGDGDPWPVGADGVGSSLELIAPATTPVDQLSKAYHWRASADYAGTPAAVNSTPLGIVISEVRSNSRDVIGEVDAIELLNISSTPVDLSNFYLSDSQNNLLKFEIPTGTLLAAGARIVFDEHQFNPTPQTPGSNHFALNGVQGDDVWLVTTDGTGNLVGLVDHVQFGAAREGDSVGRAWDESTRLLPLARATLGCANVGAMIGAVTISEINYHPTFPTPQDLLIDPFLEEDHLEYLELRNGTLSPIDLSGWRLSGDVSYEIPADTVLPAGHTLLVLPFNPSAAANAARIAAFRNHYAIDTDSAMVGGYQGQLSDSDEIVRLESPGAPTAGVPSVTPYYLVDEVWYDDSGLWPAAADGAGQTLQRKSSTVVGNNPLSWIAAPSTPGTVSDSVFLIGDVDGSNAVDARDVDAIYDAVRHGVDLAAYDLNGDSVVNAADVRFLVENVLNTSLGDVNLDGYVDASDFNLWNTNKFSSCMRTWSTGDLSGDGFVDTTDFNLWFSRRFTGTGLANATAAATPRAALHAVDAAISELVVSSSSAPAPAAEQRLAQVRKSPARWYSVRSSALERRGATGADDALSVDQVLADWRTSLR